MDAPIDVVTDQTSAHDPLSYVPQGMTLEDAADLRASDPAEYTRRADASMAAHCAGMVAFLDKGAEVFDYGNNLRAEAERGGFDRAFAYPGFIPAYIRPLFCEGKGPFRWAALSGDPADIAATDRAVLEEFPENEQLARWIRLAAERVAYQGLPARICWLGYGERHRLGMRFNDMVASGELQAPIVIGRDHLDCGSVASPYRETESMADGSDAIADWPLLNALVNTSSGASWVSIHHGGGVGHRPLDPRRPGRGRRRHRPRATEGRTCADERPRDGRDPPRRRRLRRGAGGRGREGRAHPDVGDRSARRQHRRARHQRLLVGTGCSASSRTSPSRSMVTGSSGSVRTRRSRRASRVPESTPREAPSSRGSSTATRTWSSRATERTSSTSGCVAGNTRRAGSGRPSRRRVRRATTTLRSNAARLRHEAIRTGTTHVEIKSGYGLTVEDETRLLAIAGEFTDDTTFLGAHVVREEMEDHPDDYVDLVKGAMLDACAPFADGRTCSARRAPSTRTSLARSCSPRERRVSVCASMPTSSVPGPGARLAAELGAASADHVTYLTEDDIWALSDAGVVATLLPVADLSTREPWPDARGLIEAGATVALATDCNPGTSFTTNMPIVVALAVTAMRMTPGGGAVVGHRGRCARPPARRRGDAAAGRARRPRRARRTQLCPPGLPPRRAPGRHGGRCGYRSSRHLTSYPAGPCPRRCSTTARSMRSSATSSGPRQPARCRTAGSSPRPSCSSGC